MDVGARELKAKLDPAAAGEVIDASHRLLRGPNRLPVTFDASR